MMNLKNLVGALLVFTCLAFAGISNPERGVQAAVQSSLLYGINNSGDIGASSNLYRIDPSTGAATLIGPVGFAQVSAMDFHPVTGVLYATGRRTSDSMIVLITVNLATGAGTVVGPLGTGNVQDISFRNSDATLFGYQAGRLITINTATGAATVIGTIDGFTEGNGIAFSPTDTLYHATDVSLGTVNQTTGARTVVANLDYSQFPGGDRRIAAMDYQPGTSILYGTVITGGGSPTFLATVNTTTGLVTNIGQTAVRMDALAWFSSQPGPGPGFETCLQDESNGNILLVNPSNGSYQFTNCRGFTIGGTGTITIKGCLVTLQVNGPDRRVLARIDTCAKTGNASIQVFSQGNTFTILDRNTTNNTCLCSGPGN